MPTILWDTRGNTKFKDGWISNEYDVAGTGGNIVGTSGNYKWYLRFTSEGSLRQAYVGGSYNQRTRNGFRQYDPVSGIVTGLIFDEFEQNGGSPTTGAFTPALGNRPFDFAVQTRWNGIDASWYPTVTNYPEYSTVGPPTVTGHGATVGTITYAVSEEYTNELLREFTISGLPAFDDDWNDPAGASLDFSSTSGNCTAYDARYAFSFKPPLFSNCYRVEFVERFVPKGGVPLSSIEIANSGWGFTGTPGFSIIGGGGSGAAVTATVQSGVILSVNLISSGSGYKTAPSLLYSGGGGAGFTGWFHFGTETAKSWQWDGSMPAGYVFSGSNYLTGSVNYIPVPTALGTTTVGNLRVTCDGCI